MIIASLLEDHTIEKRIAITPDIAKKYINLGFEVQLSEDYGKHLGFRDEEFTSLGVKIVKDEKKMVSDANIILQVGLISDEKISNLSSNQTFVGVLNPYENEKKIKSIS